jgi:transcriptional regulator with XRE-family HTH domain
MGFKENLRRLREAAGLTQTAMAEKAGVPFRSYQNWEAGVREPRIQALAALAAAVGVTVDELIREGPDAGPGQSARKGAAGGAPPKKPRGRKEG